LIFYCMSSVQDFANEIFSSEPKPAGTVNLDIDVSEPSEFFEVCLIIMTEGMKKWYGPRINIADVSAEHIVRLREYFLSFGVLLIVDTADEPDIYMIDNKAYVEKTDLKDMTFSVAAHKKLYTVRFVFAPTAEPRW
jgi:hypothetical protein